MWLFEILEEKVFNIGEEYVLPVLKALETSNHYVEIEIKETCKNYINYIIDSVKKMFYDIPNDQTMVISYRNFKTCNFSEIVIKKSANGEYQLNLVKKIYKNLLLHLFDMFFGPRGCCPLEIMLKNQKSINVSKFPEQILFYHKDIWLEKLLLDEKVEDFVGYSIVEECEFDDIIF